MKLDHVDQSRDALDGEKRVWETISDGEEFVMLGHREVPARAYASWFNFTGADQQKPEADEVDGTDAVPPQASFL